MRAGGLVQMPQLRHRLDRLSEISTAQPLGYVARSRSPSFHSCLTLALSGRHSRFAEAASQKAPSRVARFEDPEIAGAAPARASQPNTASTARPSWVPTQQAPAELVPLASLSGLTQPSAAQPQRPLKRRVGRRAHRHSCGVAAAPIQSFFSVAFRWVAEGGGGKSDRVKM